MKRVVFSIIGVLVSIFLNAQSAIPSSGGNASGSGGSASYTFGQIVYTTNTGTNGTVSQGVQQPFEISVITGVEEARGIDLSFLAYPNPTSDFLKLRIENYDRESLSYKLFDINGILLQNKKITSNETIIDMSSLASGAYFLIIADYNRELKSFNIIKN